MLGSIFYILDPRFLNLRFKIVDSTFQIPDFIF